MASVFVRRGKYWLKYLDPVTSTWRMKPTPLHYPADARKARQLKALTTAGELRKGPKNVRNDERWNAWVPKYMQSRYGKSKTHLRYSNSWSHLLGFLEAHGIDAPAAWKAEHNALYVEWKLEQPRINSGDKKLRKGLFRSKNVAIWDLGVMGMLMNEAKRRGFVIENKVSKARIKRGKTKQKPALTDEQIGLIRAKLAKHEDQDMATAFEIGLHTGCRLAETSIPFDRIDLQRGTITFIPKGGEERAFTAPIIFPEFKDWLGKLIAVRKAAGFKKTCNVSGQTSRNFGRMCDKMKLNDITFHALRVTFVSRAFEAGLSGEVIRKLVGHANVLINRLYQRMSIEGLQALGARLSLPVVGTEQTGQTPSAIPPLPSS